MPKSVPPHSLGPLVAAGRTSDVYEFDADRVVKVLRAGVPDEWAEREAHLTGAVRRQGVSVPETYGVVDIDGRPGIVFERIVGPSMWQQMLDDPDRVVELTRLLVAVQNEIHRAGMPEGVPDLVLRTGHKLQGVGQLTALERREGRALVEALPRGAALLHGDLHPGNLLMRDGGPVVIDWLDAAIGHPVADVVRSSILMRPARGGSEQPHLPNATPSIVLAMHDAYVDARAGAAGSDASVLCRWEAVVAASRLVEGAQADESTLISLWKDRHRGAPSAALSA